MMNHDFQAAARFPDMVRADPAALRFFSGCDPIQRRAIYSQLDRVDSPELLRGFVDNLPSAAL